ncbi:MAG: TonB-dependent receptor [Pseudomonadales bacterium]
MISKYPRLVRTPLYAAIVSGSLFLAGTAQALMLEEVVVTAQKRTESLQDVPISITAVSGAKMTENNLFKIEDLQAYVPNLSMTETGISTQIYIRGIGTGNNIGFEQSVGTYVDGIYYGRQQLLRMPFLDLERIEVLRGPQSILFGKNSIAGAMSMTTAKPSDELEGRVSVNYSPDGDITEFTGMISGPLTDTLSGRLVARKYDEKGWMENTLTGADELERDDTAIRGSLRWDATENLRIDFKAEWDEFSSTGRQIEIVQDDPALAGAPIPGATFAQILGLLGYPDAITEVSQNNKRQADTGDSSHNEVQNYTLNIDYAIGDMTLTAVSGFVTYELDDLYDLDFVGAPVFEGPGKEDYDQFSQEIRLVSPGGQTIDWIAGGFYQTSELVYTGPVVIFENSVLGSVDPGLAPILGTTRKNEYTADSDLWAVFAQATWNFTDSWSLTLGGRYTSEEKQATREMNILDTDTGEITTNPLAGPVWTIALGVENEQFTGHSLAGTRDESVFTPLVNLQWQANDEMMVYASWSSGFKSGGFDALANVVSSWEFEEEEATTYELGAKTTWLDGAAELNVALYRTEYDNLQVSQFDGNLGFTVGNAKETLVQGIELEGRWALTQNLTMGYGLAFLDHEYKDFRNGNCYNRQEPDGDVVGGVPLCDYTGKRGQYTPKWTGNLSFTHILPLAGELDLQTGFDVSYKGEQNTHVNLDPQWEVDALTQMNFRIGLYSSNWNVAVLVQNLSDDQQYSYVGNTPLSASIFGTNTFYSFMGRPRTTYLQATYNF